MSEKYSPIIYQLVFSIGLGAFMIVGSMIFGKKGNRNKIKDSAYECGMLPLGSNKPRFSIKFYVVAMLFVLFDIEVIFLYPWALNFNTDLADTLNSTALYSFSVMLIFVTILFVAYLYALKKGILNWHK